MKTKSKFKALPREDQDTIFHLCENNTFDRVVEILEQPRPAGFGLKTSYSAVRRFYLEYNPDAQATQVLDQYAHGLRIQHLGLKGDFASAILVHVESRILNALKKGKSVAELQSEFKTMVALQSAFIKMENWRAQSGPLALKEHRDFADFCARGGADDFKPVVPGDNTPFVEKAYGKYSDEQIAILDQALALGDMARLSILYNVEGYPMDLILQRRELHLQKIAAEGAQSAGSNSANGAHEPALAGSSHQKTPVKPLYPPKVNTLDSCEKPASRGLKNPVPDPASKPEKSKPPLL